MEKYNIHFFPLENTSYTSLRFGPRQMRLITRLFEISLVSLGKKGASDPEIRIRCISDQRAEIMPHSHYPQTGDIIPHPLMI